MRRFQVMLAIALCCSTTVRVSAQSRSQTEPQVAITISAAKKVSFVGEPIRLIVRMSNVGESPALIANNISTAESSNCGGYAHVVVSVKDSHGRSCPAMRLIADCFEPAKPSNGKAAEKLLGSWALLYPHNSMLFEISIDRNMFAALAKPGVYSISAIYSSKDVLTGGEDLGLSKESLNSLPYASWSGKTHTNTVSFTVANPPKRAP